MDQLLVPLLQLLLMEVLFNILEMQLLTLLSFALSCLWLKKLQLLMEQLMDRNSLSACGQCFQALQSPVPWSLRNCWYNCVTSASGINCLCSYILRNGNVVAAALAKNGHGLQFSSQWQTSPPSFLDVPPSISLMLSVTTFSFYFLVNSLYPLYFRMTFYIDVQNI